MAKNLEIAVLLDLYGDMLTEKQRDFLGYYYNDDLSLSEIAENEGITRQGVRDAIKRAEAQLFDMESKLKLASKFDEIRSGLTEIIDCAGEIGDYNLNHSLSREVNDYTVKIHRTPRLAPTNFSQSSTECCDAEKLPSTALQEPVRSVAYTKYAPSRPEPCALS